MLPEYRWRVGRDHGTCAVETVGAMSGRVGFSRYSGGPVNGVGLEWERVNVLKRMDAR
jgi:hypothetical protein